MRRSIFLPLHLDDHLQVGTRVIVHDLVEHGGRHLARPLGEMTAEGSADGVPPLRSVVGQAAPEVASVIIEREEGEPVTATVSGGYSSLGGRAAPSVRITAYDEDDNALGSIYREGGVALFLTLFTRR